MLGGTDRRKASVMIAAMRHAERLAIRRTISLGQLDEPGSDDGHRGAHFERP